MSPTTSPTRVALLGSPNAGKTTIFNHLTGLRARTANYPGVTVTRTEGLAQTPLGPVAIEDVPGTYSLSAMSPDEQVVVDLLDGTLEGCPAPDALVVVLDATTLRRSLTLAAQALAIDRPVIVALTMLDELTSRGGELDVAALGRALGVRVVGLTAHKGVGISDLAAELGRHQTWPAPPVLPPLDDDELSAWAASVLAASGYRAPAADRRTAAIDRVLLHPIWGGLVFLAVMFVFFQLIFTVAAPLQDGLEWLLGVAAGWTASTLGHNVVGAFLSEAVIGGVGSVLVFVPQIALLFLIIAALESVGYMARAAYLMDRIMAATGLDGRAFVAMLSSFACAVPGIMATRTIPSSKTRIATILSAPLVPCSARLPVYVLLVGLLVPAGNRWGPVQQQGMAMFALYLVGGLSAMISARLLRSTVLRGELVPFYLEMPPYRLPGLRSVLVTMWGSVSMFLRKAGTIIFGTAIVLWLLLAFPTRDAETLDMPPAQASAYVLEHSYAAGIGSVIEPVFEPLGFDWRIDLGLVGAMSAREVFVATLGQVAAAADPEHPATSLRAATYLDGPHRGEPLFSAPTVVALLAWFVYALQCMSTVAVMRRETGSWRWPALAFGYLLVLAYGMAFVAHEVTVWIT
ncbi:MAG: ferrous iron transporter B [Kineosporiaceae bacterium]|nr:ferrous iron transporter B [Kineosporiaceae bacterium]